MKMDPITVEICVNNLKICSKCNTAKDSDSFYSSKGKIRSECKACTIKKNVYYQKKTKSWKNRFIDSDEKRSYMVDYYAKNRDKFAEYRKTFREKHPEYFKLYSRKRKNEGWKSEAGVNNSPASGHRDEQTFKGVAV